MDAADERLREWRRGDDGAAPVNLTLIEHGIRDSPLEKMQILENGKADYRKITDMELCCELDSLARNRYGKHSVYQLSLKEKEQIAEYLYKVRHIGESQIRSSLVLPKSL